MGNATKHLVNGIVSLVISVAITVYMADDDDGPWDLSDMALAAGVSGFSPAFSPATSRSDTGGCNKLTEFAVANIVTNLQPPV